MKDGSKLYRVQLQGMGHGFGSTNAPHGDVYVIAKSVQEAADTAIKRVQDRNLGFSKERALKSVTLLADSYEHTDAPMRLLFADDA